MTAVQQASLRFLRLMIFASVLLPVILFLLAAWLNYGAITRAADERIARFLTISHEHSLNLFRSANSLLRAADEVVGIKSDEDIVAREGEYHAALDRLAQTNPLIRSIWIFDQNAVPLVSSRTFPVPKNFDNRDRDYFQSQIASDAGFYIGQVVEPKVRGEAIFSVSRRRSAQGFNGVIAIAIRPVDIQGYYEAIGSETGSYFALLRDDGAFLARHPAPVALGLRLTEQSATRRAIAVHGERGILSINSQTDAVARRMGYEKIPGLPLYVLAGIDSAFISQQWRAVLASYLVFGVPATAGLFLALLYGLRRTKRLYEEEAAREKAESALRQAQKMDAIGQLTGGFAHDFNNLLMVVLGNLDTARRGLTDGASTKLERAIDSAKGAAVKAAALTQRLLAFARRQHLDPKPFNPGAALQEFSPLLKKALGDTRALEFRCDSDWNVEADPTQLEVALLNLVVNARDATEPQDTVTITCTNRSFDSADRGLKSGDYVEITVVDRGVGMSNEQCARAFEPFYTTKPIGEGTGLGLSQVFGFVQQSRGNVEIDSEPGKGTSVRLYLPRSAKTAEELNRPNRDRFAVPAGKGEVILVVEDDQEVRKFIRATLTDLNYDVTEAQNGLEALTHLRSRRFDVVVTDVLMPGMTGTELATALFAIAPKTKVLFMTGYAGVARGSLENLRLDGPMLRKPFSREDLADALREALTTQG